MTCCCRRSVFNSKAISTALKKDEETLVIAKLDDNITHLCKKTLEVSLDRGLWARAPLSALLGYAHPLTINDGATTKTVYVRIQSLVDVLGIRPNQAKKILETPMALTAVANLILHEVINSWQAKAILSLETGLDSLLYLYQVRDFLKKTSKTTHTSNSSSSTSERVSDLFQKFKEPLLEKAFRGQHVNFDSFLGHTFVLINQDRNLYLMKLEGVIQETRFRTIAKIKIIKDRTFCQTPLVIKWSNSSMDRSIEREYHLLTMLNSQGPRRGIQIAPRAFVRITQPGVGTNLPGYLAHRYNGDLLDYVFTSAEELIAAFSHLQEGLAFIHEKNITHGDIKPDNILVKEGRYDLADFGGVLTRATFEENFNIFVESVPTERLITLFKDNLFGVYTLKYFSSYDRDLLIKLVESLVMALKTPPFQNHPQLKTTFLTAISNTLKARDIYALGLSLLLKIEPLRIPDSINDSMISSLLEDPAYFATITEKLCEMGFDYEKAQKITTQLKDMVFAPESKTGEDLQAMTTTERDRLLERQSSSVQVRLNALRRPLFSE